MKIGYARVSTDKQTAVAQRRSLKGTGCERIVEEQASGAKDRPQLVALLDSLEAGDTLAVWKFDRLGRSLPDLLDIVTRIEAKAAHLVSLTEQIDTSTSSGRMVFHVMGALAQFERDLISERTKAGLEAARAEGVTLGRPRKLTPAKIKHARKLIDSGESPPRVAKSLGVGASTLAMGFWLCNPSLTAQLNAFFKSLCRCRTVVLLEPRPSRLAYSFLI